MLDNIHRDATRFQQIAEMAASTANKDLASADQALREWAGVNQLCPVCGGAVDADKLVNAIAAGIGGHSHG